MQTKDASELDDIIFGLMRSNVKAKAAVLVNVKDALPEKKGSGLGMIQKPKKCTTHQRTITPRQIRNALLAAENQHAMENRAE